MPETNPPSATPPAEGAVVYRIGDLLVDPGRASVTRDGTELPLPKLTFDLFLILIQAAPRLATADELIARVWPGLVVSPETLSQRVKLLREALDDDSKKPRYVAGVRGRGYRLIAPVARVDEAAAVAPPPPTPRFAAWKWAALGAGVAVLVLMSFFVMRRTDDVLLRTTTAAAVQAPAKSIAVLPFESGGMTPDEQIISFGIAETVLHKLANLSELTVIARTSSFALGGKDEDAREIGRKLNVRYLLEGSVQSDRDRLRVTAQLIDAATGVHVWSIQRDQSRQDIFSVQDHIAVEVARAMQLTLDAQSMARLQALGTKNFDAYFAFQQAQSLLGNWRVSEIPAAITLLTKAIALDPGFAQAYVTLASARVRLAEFEISDDRRERFAEALEQARTLIEKALTIDPREGEAFVERGYLTAFTDLSAAEADYRQGLELNPNNARGYEGLATILFESPERRPEALTLLDRARQLDPLEARYDVAKAVYLFYGFGERQQAAALLTQALDTHPDYYPALVRLSALRWSWGEYAQAVRLARRALSIDPSAEDARRLLVRVLLDLGDAGAARQVIAEARLPLAARHLAVDAFNRNWRRAAETAHQAIADGTLTPVDGPLAVGAIRLHARASGDYSRAIAALEELSGVTWDESGQPVTLDRTSLKEAAVGLGDMLVASGDADRGQALLRQILSDIDGEMQTFGRSEMWYAQPRTVALALLGQREAALDAMERAAQQRMRYENWWFHYEFEPALAPLRGDPRFTALRAQMRAHQASERGELERLDAQDRQ